MPNKTKITHFGKIVHVVQSISMKILINKMNANIKMTFKAIIFNNFELRSHLKMANNYTRKDFV